MTMRLAPSTQRALRFGLAVLAVVTILVSFRLHYLWTYPTGVDLEIPLRAAERWASGGQAYLASAFTAPPGPTQPFLYPPWVLPVLAPLVSLPRDALELAWCGVCLGAALWALRRLALPVLWWPAVLLWPPFVEPIIGGNVQIVLFAAFVAVFYRPDRVGDHHGTNGNRDAPDDAAAGNPALTGPRPRDIRRDTEPHIWLGLLAAWIGALKVSQPFAWLFVARHRPVAALAGALPLLAIVAATFVVTGPEPWQSWVAQLQRASDPVWDLGGFAVARASPAVLGVVVSIIAVALLWFVPSRDAGPWVGLLTVIGTPSLQIFGLLFLVPALLVIRREFALIAVMAIAATSYTGMWAGILIVAVTLTGGLRWPGLWERPARSTA